MIFFFPFMSIQLCHADSTNRENLKKEEIIDLHDNQSRRGFFPSRIWAYSLLFWFSSGCLFFFEAFRRASEEVFLLVDSLRTDAIEEGKGRWLCVSSLGVTRASIDPYLTRVLLANFVVGRTQPRVILQHVASDYNWWRRGSYVCPTSEQNDKGI